MPAARGDSAFQVVAPATPDNPWRDPRLATWRVPPPDVYSYVPAIKPGISLGVQMSAEEMRAYRMAEFDREMELARTSINERARRLYNARKEADQTYSVAKAIAEIAPEYHAAMSLSVDDPERKSKAQDALAIYRQMMIAKKTEAEHRRIMEELDRKRAAEERKAITEANRAAEEAQRARGAARRAAASAKRDAEAAKKAAAAAAKREKEEETESDEDPEEVFEREVEKARHEYAEVRSNPLHPDHSAYMKKKAADKAYRVAKKAAKKAEEQAAREYAKEVTQREQDRRRAQELDIQFDYKRTFPRGLPAAEGAYVITMMKQRHMSAYAAYELYLESKRAAAEKRGAADVLAALSVLKSTDPVMHVGDLPPLYSPDGAGGYEHSSPTADDRLPWSPGGFLNE